MSIMSGRFAVIIAASAAMAALAAGIVFGTHVAGGSDSSCYLNTAKLFSRGEVVLRQPLVRAAPWKNAAWTFAPAGFVPSTADPEALVPICSPGLSLTMAAFRVVGLSEFLVVPLLGALAIWLTFVVGRRLDRPLAGAATAVLTAASPTFLYQVVQPMSDVPATAWWLLAIAWSIGDDDHSNVKCGMAGLAASMALLTRPNLLPLAVVIVVYLSRRLRVVSGSSRTRVASGFSRTSAFAHGLLPGVLLLGVLQAAIYGSPISTGYGNVSDLMSMAHIVPNARRYIRWLLGSHTPFLLLALAAPIAMRRAADAWFCLAFCATTLACYLPYAVFDDWWYTRFLLPAIPLLVILSVAVLFAGIEALRSWALALAGPLNRPPRGEPYGRMRPITDGIALAILVVLAGIWTITARERHAFDLSESEQHYYRAGIAAARLPAASVIVTVRDSGSVLYHTDRPIVSWDTLESGELDTAMSFVREQGFTPYLLLEIDEEPVFRERFSSASAIGGLDWPPRIQVGRTIRIYEPLDRARFLSNGQVATEFIRESPAPARDWRRWLR